MDEKIRKILVVVDNNRFKCSHCGGRIFIDDKIFRFKDTGFRHSSTVNLCPKCILQMFLELNVDMEYVSNAKKEFLVNSLNGDLSNGK